jgi:hypothetical protein
LYFTRSKNGSSFVGVVIKHTTSLFPKNACLQFLPP